MIVTARSQNFAQSQHSHSTEPIRKEPTPRPTRLPNVLDRLVDRVAVLVRRPLCSLHPNHGQLHLPLRAAAAATAAATARRVDEPQPVLDIDLTHGGARDLARAPRHSLVVPEVVCANFGQQRWPWQEEVVPAHRLVQRRDLCSPGAGVQLAEPLQEALVRGADPLSTDVDWPDLPRVHRDTAAVADAVNLVVFGLSGRRQLDPELLSLLGEALLRLRVVRNRTGDVKIKTRPIWSCKLNDWEASTRTLHHAFPRTPKKGLRTNVWIALSLGSLERAWGI